MCPPTNFSVAYDINPWMTRNVGMPTLDAVRQWERFVEVLECAGDVQGGTHRTAPGRSRLGLHRECRLDQRTPRDPQQLPPSRAASRTRRVSSVARAARLRDDLPRSDLFRRRRRCAVRSAQAGALRRLRLAHRTRRNRANFRNARRTYDPAAARRRALLSPRYVPVPALERTRFGLHGRLLAARSENAAPHRSNRNI